MKIFSLCALSTQAYEIGSRRIRQAPEDRGISDFINVFDVFNGAGSAAKYQNYWSSYGKSFIREFSWIDLLRMSLFQRFWWELLYDQSWHWTSTG